MAVLFTGLPAPTYPTRAFRAEPFPITLIENMEDVKADLLELCVPVVALRAADDAVACAQHAYFLGAILAPVQSEVDTFNEALLAALAADDKKPEVTRVALVALQKAAMSDRGLYGTPLHFDEHDPADLRPRFQVADEASQKGAFISLLLMMVMGGLEDPIGNSREKQKYMVARVSSYAETMGIEAAKIDMSLSARAFITFSSMGNARAVLFRQLHTHAAHARQCAGLTVVIKRPLEMTAEYLKYALIKHYRYAITVFGVLAPQILQFVPEVHMGAANFVEGLRRVTTLGPYAGLLRPEADTRVLSRERITFMDSISRQLLMPADRFQAYVTFQNGTRVITDNRLEEIRAQFTKLRCNPHTERALMEKWGLKDVLYYQW